VVVMHDLAKYVGHLSLNGYGSSMLTHGGLQCLT
jgi:hypothetical protein